MPSRAAGRAHEELALTSPPIHLLDPPERKYIEKRARQGETGSHRERPKELACARHYQTRQRRRRYSARLPNPFCTAVHLPAAGDPASVWIGAQRFELHVPKNAHPTNRGAMERSLLQSVPVTAASQSGTASYAATRPRSRS
jgi:hypothetical protein